ncbi:uncharacterized protein LOC135246853 [Anguilla rostrata]|uniref:uncharacterized protein LOC135246853 n=1 Tax=Anguilla rostrata TaxID=7938 RepID=UPI0030D5D085
MAQSHGSCSTTREEATSKWSGVIKNSKQIATEPIRTHLLNTVKRALNKDGLIRRYTFGRKDPNKRNRTIMMVGETGTGKSALINMIVNYMLGVEWEDKIRFEIIPDEGKRPKTSLITTYEIFGLEELSVPFSLTVIDTPGFGDTGGLEKEKGIAENLYKLLNYLSSIQQLDAVCLVVKASQNRLTYSQKYFFDAIPSIFGKNTEKNILTLITFSDWMPPLALEALLESDVPFLKDENNEPVHFLFNSHPLQKFAKKYEETYKTSWDNGTESFGEFFETLDKMEPQSLGEIKNVLKQHHCLEDFFSKLESQIRDVGEKHKGLEDVQKTLKEYRQDSEKNNFEYKYNEVVKKKVKTTSKWSDVIENSKQIATEPKQTYLLNTAKIALNKDGLIRRYTFGRKDPNKRNRTILMVGETGTGKSVLINMMVNYMLGVKWEDKIRFEIISDEGKRPNIESQTSAITAYEIFGLEELSVPFSLTVIDTPGYGNTTVKDDIIAENLYRLLEYFDIVQQLDAVCLMVKASANRFTPFQKKIFDSILSLFGKNMEKNIMTLITFSDWKSPSNALEAVIESGVPFPKDEIDEPVHFLFNNCPLNYYQNKYEKSFKQHWDNGTESMRKFFQTLDRMESRSLRMTEEVLRERRRLEACIQTFESQIKVVEMKRKALEEVKKTLKKHKEDMRRNNNFQYTSQTVVMEKIPVGEAATSCSKCEVTCHTPCTRAPNLWWCHVMDWSGKCTACPGKCSYTFHKRECKIYARKHVEKTETREDLKKTCETMIATQEKMMSTREQELRNAEAEKTSLIERCFQCILQLRKLALKFDSDSTRQSILRQIEMLKKNNEAEKAEMLQKILENTA